MRPCSPVLQQNVSAFARVEVLVIVFTLAILALTLFPALARMHTAPQGMQCLYNLRQITAGWWMYAEDSQGKLAASRGLLPANEDYTAYPIWVAGSMTGGSVGSPYTGVDATNNALLVNPNFSQMAAYIKNPILYRCPADQSTWSTTLTPGSHERPRVRSYSMNAAIGPCENGTLVGKNVRGHWLSGGNASARGGSPWRVPIKVSDLVAPVPSQLFLLLDEHPDTINEANFAFKMPLNAEETEWYMDVPAPYHDNGCNFSFADGHVEYHQWMFPQAFPPVIWEVDDISGTPNLGGNQNPNNPDVLWVAHRISALVPGASQTVFEP